MMLLTVMMFQLSMSSFYNDEILYEDEARQEQNLRLLENYLLRNANGQKRSEGNFWVRAF